MRLAKDNARISAMLGSTEGAPDDNKLMCTAETGSGSETKRNCRGSMGREERPFGLWLDESLGSLGIAEHVMY